MMDGWNHECGGDPPGRPHKAMRRIIPLSILCLALAPAACGAPRSIYDLDPKEINHNETVSLHFDWPAGMMANVRSFVTKSHTVGGAVTTTTVEVRSELHTESAANGIRVLYENPTLVEGDEALKLFLEGAPGLLAHPVLTVDPQGTITRIDGLGSVPGALKQALAGEAGLSPNTRGAIDVLSDPKTLDHVARQEWWNLVAFWNGKVLRTGTTYDATRQATVPGYDDTIDWTQHYTLAGRVPCNEQDQSKGCVKLELISTPDPEQFDRVVKKVIASPGQAGAERRSPPDILLRGVQYHYTLVTKPERLAPFYVDDRRSMTMELPGTGTRVIMDVVEERHDSYDYIATGMEKVHAVQ